VKPTKRTAGCSPQHLADRRGIAGEDVEYALRHAGFLRQRTSASAVNGFHWRLEHHRAAAASAGDTFR